MSCPELTLLECFDNGTLIMGKCGQVFCTVDRRGNGKIYGKLTTPKLISRVNPDGYVEFTFLGKNIYCHRMQMVLHTRQPIPKDMVVMHQDETRNNNYIENLKIGTHKENQNAPGFKKIQRRNSLGQKHSPESILRQSSKTRGQSRTAESKRNMSEAHKGKRHSDETKRKLSELLKGKNSPNFGKPGYMLGKTMTAEAKQKIGEASKRSWETRNRTITEEKRLKLKEAWVRRKTKLLTTKES